MADIKPLRGRQTVNYVGQDGKVSKASVTSQNADGTYQLAVPPLSSGVIDRVSEGPADPAKPRTFYR